MKKGIVSLVVAVLVMVSSAVTVFAAPSVVGTDIPTDGKNATITPADPSINQEKEISSAKSILGTSKGVSADKVLPVTPVFELTAVPGEEFSITLNVDLTAYDVFLAHFINNEWIIEPSAAKVVDGKTVLSATLNTFSPFTVLAVSKADVVTSPKTGVVDSTGTMIAIIAIVALGGSIFAIRKVRKN